MKEEIEDEVLEANSRGKKKPEEKYNNDDEKCKKQFPSCFTWAQLYRAKSNSPIGGINWSKNVLHISIWQVKFRSGSNNPTENSSYNQQRAWNRQNGKFISNHSLGHTPCNMLKLLVYVFIQE